MKQKLVLFFICILCTLIPISVPDYTLNILYGVVGVLFSVGMSLVMVFNGSNIKNKVIRSELRNNIHIVRDNFLQSFCISSLLYVAYSLFGINNKYLELDINPSFSIKLSCSMLLLSFLLCSVLVMVLNYIQLQELFEEIEDKIEEEKDKYKKCKHSN